MRLLDLQGAMGTKKIIKDVKHQWRPLNTKRTMETNRSTSAYALLARIAAAGPVEGWEGQAGAERTRTYRLRPAKACRSLPGPAVACQGLPGPARACQSLKRTRSEKTKKTKKDQKKLENRKRENQSRRRGSNRNKK